MTDVSACSQGLDIQLIVLLTPENSDLTLTQNSIKGNIIGCHLIRINVKAGVCSTCPWDSCKMWFPWKPIRSVRHSVQKQLQTSVPGQHECFNEFVFIGRGLKNNNRPAKVKIGSPALKHVNCVTAIVQKHPRWRHTEVLLVLLALCVSVKTDVHLWAANDWIFQSVVVSLQHSLYVVPALACLDDSMEDFLRHFKAFCSYTHGLAELFDDFKVFR